MNVRLNITMDEDLYMRLKKELPPKGISAFIASAIRARLQPDRQVLDAAYKAAAEEAWRKKLAHDWKATELEDWPR
jgi:hypothetical protein